jgi:hypothetical protein
VKLPLQKSSFSPATVPENYFDGAKLTWELVVDVGASSSLVPGNGARKLCLMRHGVDGFSPSSWEPQEEGMMSTAANFPSVRNQGLFVSRKNPNSRR